MRMEHLGLGNDPEMPAALAWSPEFHASGEVLVEAVQYPRVDPLTVAVEASEGNRHSSAIGEHYDNINRGLASHQAWWRLLIISFRALSRLVNKRAPQQLKHEVALDRGRVRYSCSVASLVVQVDPTVVVEAGHQCVSGNVGMPKGKSGPLVSLVVRKHQLESSHWVRAMNVDHGLNAIVSHLDTNDVRVDVVVEARRGGGCWALLLLAASQTPPWQR